jgi:hypothetical protein
LIVGGLEAAANVNVGESQPGVLGGLDGDVVLELGDLETEKGDFALRIADRPRLLLSLRVPEFDNFFGQGFFLLRGESRA